MLPRVKAGRQMSVSRCRGARSQTSTYSTAFTVVSAVIRLASLEAAPVSMPPVVITLKPNEAAYEPMFMSPSATKLCRRAGRQLR